MKYFRVKVFVETCYDVKAENEEYAISQASYEYMVNEHEPSFEVEEIDEEDYEEA